MAVIAISRLVVVAKNADALDDMGQRIFVSVRRAAHGFWDTPDPQLHKGAIVDLMALAEQQFSRDILFETFEAVVTGRQDGGAPDGAA